MEDEQGLPAWPGDVADGYDDADKWEAESKEADQNARNREFVISPLPSRSPMLGWKLSVPAILLYRPEGSSPDDRAWVTGAGGFYAENESWGAGLFHRMSFGGDRWRITGAGFYGEVNYDFFGIGATPDFSVEINQPTGGIVAEALRQVYPDLFIGLRASYTRTEARLRDLADRLPPGLTPPELSKDFDLISLSPKLVFDTRDTEFYPTRGVHVTSMINIAREQLGSDRDYEKYLTRLNLYTGLSDSLVLASRVAVEHVAGDAPFFAFSAFGANGDLRGYQAGLYRDRFLFAAQTELRYRFHPRFGVVAFAGLGTVAPDFAGWGDSLGSVGGGIRWVAAPKNDVSLRIDLARGRDGTEIYLSIGEAF